MDLVDPFGRTIRDLRISVTDRCNFRCTYCMPEEGMQWVPRSEVLTFEEIERFVRVAAPHEQAATFELVDQAGGGAGVVAQMPREVRAAVRNAVAQRHQRDPVRERELLVGEARLRVRNGQVVQPPYQVADRPAGLECLCPGVTLRHGGVRSSRRSSLCLGRDLVNNGPVGVAAVHLAAVRRRRV